MGVPTRTVAVVALWIITADNAAVAVLDVAARSYRAAALQSIAVAVGAAWIYLMPKVDAWLDARLAEARAQQRLAELALGEMERMQRGGNLRVHMNLETPDRVN